MSASAYARNSQHFDRCVENMKGDKTMMTYATDDVVSYLVARLEQDPRVNLHDSPITVSLVKKKVMLEGQVDDIAEKRATIDTVTRVLLKMGRWQIVDRLHVKPTRHRRDLELMNAVVSALSNEPVFRKYSLLTKAANHIEVQRDKGVGSAVIITMIEHGCISLAGQVESLTHRRLAEVLMWWTDGCEFVDNQLQIVPAEQDTDNEIADTIRCVLAKDPLVHAGQLLVGTAAGVVIMNGSVASKEEKKLAIQDAWYVPGVANVVDHIRARG